MAAEVKMNGVGVCKLLAGCAEEEITRSLTNDVRESGFLLSKTLRRETGIGRRADEPVERSAQSSADLVRDKCRRFTVSVMSRKSCMSPSRLACSQSTLVEVSVK